MTKKSKKVVEKTDTASSQFIYEAVKEKLDDQFSLVNTLDQKSAIIVALDAGFLALAIFWERTNDPNWFFGAFINACPMT